MSSTSKWVAVASYAAVFQAEMAVATLEHAGIPAQLRGEQAGVFGAGYSGTVTRGVAVLVPESRAVEARRLLDA